MADALRIDQWLWFVRAYKTRTIATDACRAGWVSVRGEKAKPAREVREGEVIHARVGGLVRTYRVLALPKGRIGAARVAECAEDLTPAAEVEEWRARRAASVFERVRGSGRPTKRDRRLLDELRDGGQG